MKVSVGAPSRLAMRTFVVEEHLRIRGFASNGTNKATWLSSADRLPRRTVIFDADLAPGQHVLRLRIAGSKHPESIGHAIRVLSFVAN
jgi:hypothetical protein